MVTNIQSASLWECAGQGAQVKGLLVAGNGYESQLESLAQVSERAACLLVNAASFFICCKLRGMGMEEDHHCQQKPAQRHNHQYLMKERDGGLATTLRTEAVHVPLHLRGTAESGSSRLPEPCAKAKH